MSLRVGVSGLGSEDLYAEIMKSSPFDLPLNCDASCDKQRKHNRYGNDSQAELSRVLLQYHDEQLDDMNAFRPSRFSLGRMLIYLHCDSSKTEEVELQETNHNLVPLVHR